MNYTVDILDVRYKEHTPARRQSATDAPSTDATPAQVRPYGARLFAAYDKAGELVAVTVYKKGAREIVARLADLEAQNAQLRAELEAARS